MKKQKGGSIRLVCLSLMALGLILLSCPAKEQEVNYTVTFNANGGSGTVPATMMVNEGESITLPSGSGLSKTGYTFDGWNTDPFGTGANFSAGSLFTVIRNITFYAQWVVLDSVGTPKEVTIAMWDSSSDGWDDNAALRINVNGTDHANARLDSGGGPNYYQFYVETGDVVQIYWTSGSTFDRECAFAMYYSDDPPSPAFNPSSGTSDTDRVLASKRYNQPSGAVGNGTSMGGFTVVGGSTTYYTVTFDANGGSGTVPAVQTVNDGESIILPGGSELSKTGCTFDGWNTSADGTGTNYSAGFSYTVTGDVTLYAKWITVVITANYTVTFDANDGSGTVPAIQTVNDGESITLPSGSELSRSGYTFGGWNTNSSGTGTNYNAGASYTVTGDVILYAKWDVIIGTVAPDNIEYYWVDQHGSLVTTSGGTTSITVNQTLTITPQGNGYNVKQWHLDGVDTGQSGNTYTFSGIASGKHTVGLVVEKDGKLYNTNITITVTVTYYTVTFSANNGSGTVPEQTVTDRSSITLPNGSGLSRSDYTFGGWNTSASGTGTDYNAGASFTPTDNITLYAKWNYVVTFSANGGSGTAPDAQTVSPGSNITLPGGSGLSRSGYTFGGWNTNTYGTGTNYSAGASYTPNANITLYAVWTNTVTYDINGGTGTTPSAQTANAGNSVTLASRSGLSRSGYFFGGWNTNTSGTGINYSAGASYTPAGDITLYARWTTSRTVSINMYDSYGDGWNSAALRINVNGTNLSSNATISTGSTSSYSFTVVLGDTVNIYWVSGSYNYECSFIVYYEDTPPSPSFTSSNNTSWSGSNALVYRLRPQSSTTGSNYLTGVATGTLLGSFTVQ